VNVEGALFAQCAFLSTYAGRIAHEQRFTDNDRDFLDVACDVTSALVDDAYDGAPTARTLMERWGGDRETLEITLTGDVCPRDVREFILAR
jgi:hypothetical protein